MNEASTAAAGAKSTSATTRKSRIALLWLTLPLIALGAAITWLLTGEPLQNFRNGAPPVENLTFERTILSTDGIRLLIRAGGSEPMTIAQVQIDGAYWRFTQSPAGPVGRGDTVWIELPFPWVLGEAHAITIVTNTGATFSHEIAVAVPTPVRGMTSFASQALLGLLIGLVPVAIGMLFYPALRGVGREGMNFLLALTVGLLVFLLIDTMAESFELAAESAAIFQGRTMVMFAAAVSFILLMAAGRRRGVPTGTALATFIALGIGFHNLGEGLAIGGAFAAGAAGLGTFLVMGFMIHNVTEGIGISAPMLKTRPPLWTFAGLALLAGGPAVIGLWIGSLAYAPQWSALALAIGAGAVLQVVVEVATYLMRLDGRGPAALMTPATLTGLAGGAAFMYATAMLVKF